MAVDFKNLNLVYQLKQSQMKIFFKIFALSLIILASSCKKDIQEKQNKIILLTKPSGWLTTKIEEKQTSGNTWADVTYTIGVFDVDNLLIFDPWFVWAVNEGALKIPGNAQIPLSGTWSFTNNESKIQLDNGTVMAVNELTETSLQTTVTINGVTKRYTYKHP